ncbi:hypothetical protein HZP67_09770 [Elizabethkingia anophelis]|nr:hypothetical protein [Elizabethkingia anophelis]MCT4148128.1 hypothetical protein [Elizabethkingia anophelis]
MRIRLKEEEALFLGLTPKDKNECRNPRYSLNKDQFEKIELYRSTKAIKVQAQNIGIDSNDVKHGWFKNDEVSFFFTNPSYKSKYREDFEKKLIELISSRSPKYPDIKRKRQKKSNLLIINPADVHIGKLASAFETGDEYSSEIAINRVHEGVDGIIDKSIGFNIDKIILVGGNDILHVDTPRATTTSGTFQNTDDMWYNNFLKAFNLYVEVIEKLLVLSDVHFIFCPSNHDYQSGFFLCQSVSQYFRNNKNITFDVSIQHRKYYKYGFNLIGFTHGDGGKQQDLPLAMAHESKDWSKCKHRYIYIHHIHHKTSKDYQGVNVESMRSPSGTDSWHHRNIYCNNIKAIEGFVHDKDHGRIASLNHIF